MSKPSPAQLRLLQQLAEGATFRVISINHPPEVQILKADKLGARVRYATANALRVNGWVEDVGASAFASYYQISEAGRAALQEVQA